MHLKQLKLAGFKSFVDPTVVPFPSQLVAVVGPNGCGKSNIIDAVRWVMGESSARNLRGESMSDVIFNGSSNRKSVGQASVELVFDNSLGRLTGPFASYGEIAVKRIVTRDGGSAYYLNGSPCRRKDITDIFLGTGAGTRGYSIIGQGTISQLIEAKPDDLRVFLEEAAGVSKYKERRKETLQRIEHTRDNLTRVADIRDELEKQLQRLERQAKSAQRYLILKEEEQLCRAEILALKWRDFTVQQADKQSQLHDLAICYEQQHSLLSKANKERDLIHEMLHDAEERTQHIQTSFYQLGTEIVRLEETIQQQVREKKRLEQEQQQMQEDWRVAEEMLKQDKEELLCCQQNVRYLAEQVQQLRIQFKEQEECGKETQEKYAQCNLNYQEIQSKSSMLIREFQVAEIQAQHLNEKQQQTCSRLEKLHLEQESISLVDLQQRKKDLEEQQIKLTEDQQFDVLQLKQAQDHNSQWRSKVQETELHLHQLQDDFHRVNSEYAALVAAQHAARQGMQNNKNEIKEWVGKPRLMDVLQVESKWQKACECILNETLHAYVLDDCDELWTFCEQYRESIVTMRRWDAPFASRPRLVDKIQGEIPANAHPLEHIYAAEHIAEALSWLPDMAEYQSVVTPDGFWLGQGWVKLIQNEEQDEMGLLTRQQKIAELSLFVQELQQKISLLRAQRDEAHQSLQKSLKDAELQQINVNVSNEALRTHSIALSAQKHAILHAEKLSAALALEREELQFLLEEIAMDRDNIKEKLQVLAKQCSDFEQQQQQCVHEKQEWLNAVALQTKQMEEARQILHHAELEYDREKTKMEQLGERIHREKERQDVLQERLEHLALLCLQKESPAIDLNDQLDQKLLKQAEVESQLILSREQGTQLRMDLETIEKNILNCDLAVKGLNEQIAQVRMEEQTLSVRAGSVQESLDELSFQASALLERIPTGITQSMREDELLDLSRKIKGLGAINLAAIEEFAGEQQRKAYLDEQYDDLNQALATLEMAIEKMDKETQLRLENTFSEVNTAFKALFPRLFGGGRAALELTCDNLLEAGIVVMAQPPGKRNSTIHLLSGGEKAMTAVALVFAIFQLNPSPFCMLDEVDAPLDDVNVGRFCALVKEMSACVQFLFITHNKVTMELADHLIGVTMREPGVSRLVTVDITQALAME